jgi:hypothetical protein
VVSTPGKGNEQERKPHSGTFRKKKQTNKLYDLLFLLKEEHNILKSKNL